MNPINSPIKQVFEKVEIVTIASNGADGPHLVATWGDFIRTLGIQNENTILVPAGGYAQTEKNIKQDDRVEVLIGSKEVQGKSSMGTGYRLIGQASVMESGAYMDLVKEKYPWARAALVIEIKDAIQLL